jgi:hypothetical protein
MNCAEYKGCKTCFYQKIFDRLVQYDYDEHLAKKGLDFHDYFDELYNLWYQDDKEGFDNL